MKAYSMIKWDSRATVGVANLAREQNLLCVLPLALYQCCSMYTAKQLVTGVRGQFDALSADNIPACFTGWSALGHTQYTTTLAWIDSPDSTYLNCTSPALCADIRKEILHKISFPRVQFMGKYSWSDPSDFRYDYGIDDMCSSCNSVAEELHNVGRAKFWEALPGIFGLPDWAELRKE